MKAPLVAWMVATKGPEVVTAAADGEPEILPVIMSTWRFAGRVPLKLVGEPAPPVPVTVTMLTGMTVSAVYVGLGSR